jgi:hypothetical protein
MGGMTLCHVFELYVLEISILDKSIKITLAANDNCLTAIIY